MDRDIEFPSDFEQFKAPSMFWAPKNVGEHISGSYGGIQKGTEKYPEAVYLVLGSGDDVRLVPVNNGLLDELQKASPRSGDILHISLIGHHNKARVFRVENKGQSPV